MSDEKAKLKQKITELEFKLNGKALDLKKYQAKLAEQKAEMKIQKLDFKTKIASLKSENADLKKRKDGMTLTDVLSSIPKISNKKENLPE
jgi:hypothetical protein